MGMSPLAIVPFLFFASSLAVVIYLVALMTRLTHAAERVALSLERTPSM